MKQARLHIVYLESEQNLVWTSMQEIFPCIKNTWQSYAKEQGHVFTTINVDKSSPRLFLKELMASDLIVVSCFNGKMAQFLEILRVHLKIDSPWYFYLHGLATVGLWPLLSLGLGNALNKRDLFIGTCEGDEKALKLSLPGARYYKTHFFTESSLEDLPGLGPFKSKETSKLVFVGRLSRQKNLHLLLWALSELKKQKKHENLSLDIYGKEDDLDAPNMGLHRGNYLKELTSLGERLGLKENRDFIFHGFVKREKIEQQLKKTDFLFVGLSLHSDENFGMAALMALESGGRLVLSHWGGHQNFQQHFPDRVISIPVGLGEHGHFLFPNDVLSSLEKSLPNNDVSSRTNPFTAEKAKKHIGEMLKRLGGQESEELCFSSLSKELFNNRPQEIGAQQVFSGYDDIKAHKFFKAYGADENYSFKKEGAAVALPWVSEGANATVTVNEPHKGKWQGQKVVAFEMGHYYFKD